MSSDIVHMHGLISLESSQSSGTEKTQASVLNKEGHIVIEEYVKMVLNQLF